MHTFIIDVVEQTSGEMIALRRLPEETSGMSRSCQTRTFLVCVVWHKNKKKVNLEVMTLFQCIRAYIVIKPRGIAYVSVEVELFLRKQSRSA